MTARVAISVRTIRDGVLILITGVAWGLLAPFSKLLFAAQPAAFDGPSLAVARAAWTLPFFLITLVVAWRLERPQLDRKLWLAFLACGVCFGPGFMVLYSIASAHTSVSHIAFLVGLTPVCNAACAAAVFRLPLDNVRKAALTVGFIGVALLALTKSGNGSSLAGDGVIIVWLISFAVYTTILRFITGRFGLVFVTAIVGTIGTALVTFVGVASGAGRAIAHVADSSSIGVLFFGGVVFLATFVAPPAFAQAVRRRGIAIATSGAEYTAIAVGIVFSVAILHEVWQPLLALAGVLLLVSLALTFAPANLFARLRPLGASKL